MEINKVFLQKLMEDVDKYFDKYLYKILKASADYGMFGIQLLDALHNELPKTKCANCGLCCNSVSIPSLEYHRIIRYFLELQDVQKIKNFIHRLLFIEERLAEIGSERRLRCAFRDEELQKCMIYNVRPFACRFYGLKKGDNYRECPNVIETSINSPIITDDYMEDLQRKIIEVSENIELEPDLEPIFFFPMEFWAYKFALGNIMAVKIYKHILVPASTALTNFWKNSRNLLSKQKNTTNEN